MLFQELPPEIIKKLEDKTVTKGDKTVLEIEVTKGDALVRWFKDGKELRFSEHVQLSIDGKRQRLKIYNTQPEDEGTYSCEVGNQTSTAKLTVEEEVIDKPPSKYFNDHIFLYHNNNLYMLCT